MRKILMANFVAFGFCASFLSTQAFGQVVQLPTLHTFSIGTTVSIPDRGSLRLGGVDRASFGRNEFGVSGLGNRAISSQVQSSRVSATATIMDLKELDGAVLDQAAKQASTSGPAIARKAAFLARHIGRNDKNVMPKK